MKVETLFAARLETAAVDDSGWTEAEVRNNLEVRWFTVDELRRLERAIVPHDLADLVPVAVAALDSR